jgi:hypothetical protein
MVGVLIEACEAGLRNERVDERTVRCVNGRTFRRADERMNVRVAEGAPRYINVH